MVSTFCYHVYSIPHGLLAFQKASHLSVASAFKHLFRALSILYQVDIDLYQVDLYQLQELGFTGRT